MFPSVRVAALSFVGLSVAACSFEAFTYTVDRYGTVTGQQIRLGCRDTYEVFDRPGSGSLLVVTNGVNEGLANACATGGAALPRPERLRRVAEIFLAETTLRPDCRIARQNEVSDFHAEFRYRCPSGAEPVSTTKPRRG